MFWIRKFLVFATVLLALEFAKCENSDFKEPKECYVSMMEKSVMLVLRNEDTITEEMTSSEAPRFGSFLDDIIERGNTTIANILNPFKDKIKYIFPGMYWCSDGDILTNSEDVRLFEKTDFCCKAHDKCPSSISGHQEKDGLLNIGIFTRSHCDCNEHFYHCLKEAESPIAKDIGFTYFNILRPQCFKESYPIKNCKTKAELRLIDDKCEEYNYESGLIIQTLLIYHII
ncbi:phospholipase A2-like [Colletes latitarsis]|uniref:phospholipase A2-like n=1 Tax=Colletes latitarsis TaxID=2605962 RepID=UPI004036EFBD